MCSLPIVRRSTGWLFSPFTAYLPQNDMKPIYDQSFGQYGRRAEKASAEVSGISEGFSATNLPIWAKKKENETTLSSLYSVWFGSHLVVWVRFLFSRIPLIRSWQPLGFEWTRIYRTREHSAECVGCRCINIVLSSDGGGGGTAKHTHTHTAKRNVSPAMMNIMNIWMCTFIVSRIPPLVAWIYVHGSQFVCRAKIRDNKINKFKCRFQAEIAIITLVLIWLDEHNVYRRMLDFSTDLSQCMCGRIDKKQISFCFRQFFPSFAIVLCFPPVSVAEYANSRLIIAIQARKCRDRCRLI